MGTYGLVLAGQYYECQKMNTDCFLHVNGCFTANKPSSYNANFVVLIATIFAYFLHLMLIKIYWLRTRGR